MRKTRSALLAMAVFGLMIGSQSYAESPKVKPRPEERSTREKEFKKAPADNPVVKRPNGSDERREHPSYKFAAQAAQRSWSDPAGIWNTAYLKTDKGRPTREALEAYERREIGNSVRDFDTDNLTAEQIKEKALNDGFKHHREKLEEMDRDGTKSYITRNAEKGHRTKDPDDPDILPHDIYEHPTDKGLIRVKPEGAPKTVRPEPQVSKSVRFPNSEGSKYDTEAFKVSNGGKPVPKNPAGDDVAPGMKEGDAEKVDVRLLAIGDLGHTKLKGGQSP